MSSTTTTTASTATTTSITVVASDVGARAHVRRRVRRRLSAPSSSQLPSLKLCRSLSYNLEALDLSSASPAQTLAHLRFLVLSYLADLEHRLRAALASATPDWPSQGEHTAVEDVVQWAYTALDMLEGIRADVCSHLPELPSADMEAFLNALPDFPDVPNFADLRSHLPDMPHLPDMADVRAHFADMPSLSEMGSGMYSRLDDVRARFHELDFRGPFGYIPVLSDRLQSLNSHLSASVASEGKATISFVPNTVLSGLLDALLSSDVIADVLNSHPADVICETEDMLERAAIEVSQAVKRSFEGMRLIKYSDLPHSWRNNPFVTHGYRFIPIERWHLIVMSLVTPHNELLNIHTHLIPFLLWGVNLLTIVLTAPSYDSFDLPEILFMCFALLCLSSSAIWHTMSGCADHRSVELCARIDYVGIGWLISASVGTVVHYGFGCHPSVGHAFLGLCLATGLAGNIFPFMSWFNKHEYRFYRIGFFLLLAFSGIGPMVALSALHTRKEMYDFVAPVFPSLASYLIGLVFYAAHFPECVIPESIQRKLDMIGGGSHAIWHCFIVLAVSQHRSAMTHMKGGLECVLSNAMAA
ncbi:HlyIII-domain-containing protein [Pholiota conissans]|uniref:HlyIII-domain-containing protein n=1 Tax=Pholiota conissans TaxID=109636 RepID=A0A9P5Z8M4_9AGAR|nr:HlyIII-domain-containing protein [Pholiota conissans]